MKTALVQIILTLGLSIPAHGQTFQDFIDQVNAAPDSLRSALVDSFVIANPISPILESDTLAHYYYRGTTNSVSIPGDANQWDPAMFPMARLSTTTFWYRTEHFESDARLDYKYVLNGVTWILDPRNPNTVAGGFGPNSELRMPAFIQPPEIAYYPGIPHGTLHDTTFFSTNLGNSRTIRVYTPPGYGSPLDSFAVVVFHDGLEYVTLGSADRVLDYLIDQGTIDPIIAVFVPPVNRTSEYAGIFQDEFTLFIVEELMPWVDARWNTRRDPHQRATLGASNGGNIALWLGVSHPGVFGNIAAHSSNIQSSISDSIANGIQHDLTFYLDLGTYDIPVLIPLVRDFIPLLQMRGYPYTYAEFHEGHSWGNWRAHIDNALQALFPGPALSVDEHEPLPLTSQLLQNYPNPFNGTTTFRFRVARSGFVSLVIYNILGEPIATLANEELASGSYHRPWNSSGLASGVYFYRLTTGTFFQTRKLVLLR